VIVRSIVTATAHNNYADDLLQTARQPSTSIGRRYIAECAGHRRMNANGAVYAFTGCRRVKDQLENFRYLPWSFAPVKSP